MFDKIKEIQKTVRNCKVHNIRKSELTIVLRMLQLYGVNRVLEIGCGDGYQSYIWAKQVPEVVPTDITIKRMERKISSFVLCSATHLPFRTNTFDVTFSSHVLEHIGNRGRFLAEQKRVCKDRGFIIIIVPSAFWKSLQLLIHYLEFLYRALWIIIAFRNQPVNKRRRGVGELLSWTIPKIHGEFESNTEELLCYRKKSWLGLLYKFGLRGVLTIPTFPFGSFDFTIIPMAHLLTRPPSSFIFIVKRG